MSKRWQKYKNALTNVCKRLKLRALKTLDQRFSIFFKFNLMRHKTTFSAKFIWD